MTANAATLGRMPGTPEPDPILLGGPAALAESAWMGSVQATDVLEPLRVAPAVRRWQIIIPRRPRLRLGQLLTRPLTIAEASFVLMASFFLSAMLGAVRQVLFNAQFGISPEANAYYAAFRLPDTLFSLIAGGALSSAMIPVLLHIEREQGRATAARFTNLVLTTLLAVFSLVVLVGELLAPQFVRTILAPGFDPATSQLTVTLTRIMLVQPVILTLGTVATAVLNGRNQFVLTALSVMSHNITLIAGILAVGLWPQLGILGPTLGVVAGAVLQTIILLPGLRGAGRRFTWRPRDPNLRDLVRLLIPNGLSVGVNYSGFILDTAFATRATNPAALSAIYNAWLLVGLPIALLGQAVGQAAFPRLAAHADAHDWRAMRGTLLKSLVGVVALAVPALLGLILFGRLAIRVLFERGEFTAAAGDVTYAVLVVYAVALPAYVITEVVTRGLIALRDTRTPLVTNSLQLAGRALLMILTLAQLGVTAIPLAFAVTSTLEALALTTVLIVRIQRRQRAAQQSTAPQPLAHST